jgi:A/G-specific adenine glycosylase
VIEDLPSPPFRQRVRRQLLGWYARHRRDLPWRRSRDPYAIWVSEIMLQQTQVATVVPYFNRFLAAFPTVTDLAAAGEQEVLRVWEGLGYYRRAHYLHETARRIVADLDGRFPSDAAVLSGLPGLGRYTVNAVLSQAFDQHLPILEANSQRVLCRLFGLRGDPTRSPGRRRLWQLAEALLPQQRVGDFNQAMMELGALVCTPAAPNCNECPLQSICTARRLGIQEQIPLRVARARSVEIREVALVMRRRGKLFLAKRPLGERWGGLWEFPHGELKKHETHAAGANRLARTILGFQIQVEHEFLSIRHTVTHHRITMVCLQARWRAGSFRSAFYESARWIKPLELERFALSTPQRRVARCLIRKEEA